MTINIRNLQWLNHNAQRRYPFTVESTLQDTTGEFELPQSFIVGLKLGVHSGLSINPGKFFLKSLGNFSSGFGITIGYDSGSGVENVATANIARASFSELTEYRLIGLGNFLDATGTIVLGQLDEIDEQPAGQFEFDLADSRLETDVVYPLIRGVSSLQAQTGVDLSEKLYGDIVFQAGTNMRISVVQLSGSDPVIVFDAIEGEGLSEDCVCEDDIDLAPAIRTINGIPGTTDGDYTILGNTCLVPEAITNGLRLNDVCSEPCCGCEELEIVTAQLEQFRDQAQTLNILLANIEARVTQTDQVLLAARLGDRSCISCDDDV